MEHGMHEGKKMGTSASLKKKMTEKKKAVRKPKK